MVALREYLAEAVKAARRAGEAATARAIKVRTAAASAMREDSAQGTTEYAILVGVLVVIAIVAIIAFRDKVSELWDSISSGINSL